MNITIETMFPNNSMDPTAAANQMMQQNWSQWQAYQQQLAQWQAQYGEQYQREMLQKMGYNGAPSFPPTSGYSMTQPPIPQSQPFAIQQPAPPLPVAHPPPPMPQQPAPPPPPPEPKETINSYNTNQSIQNHHHHPQNHIHQTPNVFNVPPPSISTSQVPLNNPNRDAQLQHQTQSPVIPPSNEEIAFDEQFRKWEDEFNNWKRLNANHPDRVAYVDYETKMEQCRTKLLERREQMRQRKLQMLLKREPPMQPQKELIQQQPQQPTQNHPHQNQTNDLQHHQPPRDHQQFEQPGEEQQSQQNREPQQHQQTMETQNQPQSQYQPPQQEQQSSFSASNGSSGGIPGLDLIQNEEQHTPVQDEEEADEDIPTTFIADSDDSQDQVQEHTNEDTRNVSNLEALSKGINHILGDPSFLSLLSNLNQNNKTVAPNVTNEPQQTNAFESCEYNPIEEEEDQYQSDDYDRNNDPFPYEEQAMDEDAENEAPYDNDQDINHYDLDDRSYQPDQTHEFGNTQRTASDNNYFDPHQESANFNDEDNQQDYDYYDQPNEAYDQPQESESQFSNRIQEPEGNTHNHSNREPIPMDNCSQFNRNNGRLPNTNGPNNDIVFRPRQVINYDNVSSLKPALRSSVGAQKVFDYSHQSNSAYFKPKRFVDYGHGSQHNRGGQANYAPYNHRPPIPAVGLLQHARGGGNPFNRGGPGMSPHISNNVHMPHEQRATFPNNKQPQQSVRGGKAKVKRIVQENNPNLSRPPIQKDTRSNENEPQSNNNHQNEIVVNRNTVRVEDILFEPGRSNRPQKIVIIMRGPPGSGKSYLAKKIKDVEHNQFQASVRILSIDDYFTTESDDVEESQTVGSESTADSPIVYKYDASQEQTYAAYLMKSFKKTVIDGLFEFIIVDAINSSLAYCNELYNFGKHHGFTPYTCELLPPTDTCFARNIHQRTLTDIEQIVRDWPHIPELYLRLNVNEFLSTTTDKN